MASEGKAFKFTDDNFEAVALKKEDNIAVVDFWAPWCGPCRAIAPIIEQLAESYDGKVVVGKLDVDDNPEVSMDYKVSSIPTILIFKNGEMIHRHVGGRVTKSQLSSIIDEALATLA